MSYDKATKARRIRRIAYNPKGRGYDETKGKANFDFVCRCYSILFRLAEKEKKAEWLQICGSYGLQFEKSFDSIIRFPKKRDTAFGFDELLKEHKKEIDESYDFEVVGNEIYITEQVNNILF